MHFKLIWKFYACNLSAYIVCFFLWLKIKFVMKACMQIYQNGNMVTALDIYSVCGHDIMPDIIASHVILRYGSSTMWQTFFYKHKDSLIEDTVLRICRGAKGSILVSWNSDMKRKISFSFFTITHIAIIFLYNLLKVLISILLKINVCFFEKN